MARACIARNCFSGFRVRQFARPRRAAWISGEAAKKTAPARSGGMSYRRRPRRGGRQAERGDGAAEASGLLVIRVPVPRGAASAKDRMEATASAARRVLLIDDNLDAVEALAELLRLSGHNVRTAGDGPSALALATQFEPEFVLCDLGLPGMSGYEVALALRALPGVARAVIVALTGHGTDDDRQRSASAGFDVHLLKPVDPTVIEGLLERR